MSDVEVIGISGKAGAGKDFVGREVLRPAGFFQWSFAWPMKTTCVGLGHSFEDVMYHKPPHVREALQRIGTEDGWMKHGRMYWVDQAHAWLRIVSGNFGARRFYISDVRFPHEAEWIRTVGGQLVRVEHGDRPYPLAGTAAAAHTSETALDGWTDWDAVVRNDTTKTARDIALQLFTQGVLHREDEQLDLFPWDVR
jgi:hypothetical protein